MTQARLEEYNNRRFIFRLLGMYSRVEKINPAEAFTILTGGVSEEIFLTHLTEVELLDLLVQSQKEGKLMVLGTDVNNSLQYFQS